MHDSMLKKLDQLQNRINEIQDLLLDSKTIEDIDKYTLLNKEFSELKPIVEKFDEYNNLLKSIKVIVALGKIGFDSCVSFFRKNHNFSDKIKFSHGAIYNLPNNIKIVGCYHPSPRNVNTGRINEKKMTSLFKKVLKLI